MSHWIAVDWGTSRLRATRMAGDVPQESRESEDGMARLTRDMFESRLLSLIDDWLKNPEGGPTKVIACGMVGSRQGWAEAPYVAAPCPPLAARLTQVETEECRLHVHIVPGISQTAPHPDVMRGEETQIAGILSENKDFDGVACLPGTHTKWAHISAGEVISFRTTLTGELFATLCNQTVLRHSLSGGDWSEAAFLDAVSDALSRPEILTSRLFELRAADLLLGQDATTARSILSGLLIGAELAATKPWWLGRDVVITGADAPSKAYATALQAQGVTPRLRPANAMTLAGLIAAKALI
ncbi:MAG: 2-dehydro-3-deoxygalactonokinase [Pseudomonadota bacterium]